MGARNKKNKKEKTTGFYSVPLGSQRSCCTNPGPRIRSSGGYGSNCSKTAPAPPQPQPSTTPPSTAPQREREQNLEEEQPPPVLEDQQQHPALQLQDQQVQQELPVQPFQDHEQQQQQHLHQQQLSAEEQDRQGQEPYPDQPQPAQDASLNEDQSAREAQLLQVQPDPIAEAEVEHLLLEDVDEQEDSESQELPGPPPPPVMIIDENLEVNAEVVEDEDDAERLLYPNVNESETPLPRCWSPHDKCLSIGLSQNNLRVTYKGVGKQHSDAASVRTAYPIPSSCGLYYFEVRIISKGRNGHRPDRLAVPNEPPARLGQAINHGDDGNSFSSSGNGQTYGPTFTTGDVIGCCVNFVNNSCFYTKNGVDLGIAFRNLPTKLYPTVGLQTPGEEVDANFGQEPFKFDNIVEMMKEMRSSVLRKIDRYPHLLETPENLMNRLVSTYLVHNGYSKTAEAFNGYTNQPFDEDLSSIKTRQNIIKLILTGKMSQAIGHTLRSYPGLLENNKNLWFALKCRQFIEMINGADVENANNNNMPTNQTSVIQSTKAFKHSKSGNGNGNGNINQSSQQQPNNTATPAVIKPQVGDKADTKSMLVDDNSNKCLEHDRNSMDVEMEPCQSHSNGGGGGDSNSCSNGNASAVRNSLDAIDEEMDVDVSPSSRSGGRVIEKILEFGKELSSMGQQLEKENLMTEEERQMLEDAFSLIAYSNP
ncbi:hypothetical protein KR200_007153 [Drosophila serrata]|nr:hypothetical protein KR200_007153 [Drosophila serrata]